jgi:tetratricopeptide (TPR) repeat protein
MEVKPVMRVAWVLLLAAIAIAASAVVYQRSWRRTDAPAPVTAGLYADPGVCATCHAEIADTYGQTGMARSFSRLQPDKPVADFAIPNRFQHPASDRYYATEARGGRVYQRRHELDVDGKETNTSEYEAAYVIGSGNHARTLVHRSPDGRLLEMPVSWYSERGGYWAMSPGYDRPAHQDFRRLINEGCMTCHNGYPRGAVRDDGNGPKFAEPLPEGIDCQRCHGPGQGHVDAIKRGDIEDGRLRIANPATFDRERQLETCMQCHLESTSSPLPFQIRRDEHPPFSYTPGKRLADYFIFFDHAPGTGRDDKFEIASGAYRLRKSACFQQSAMTCVTCHDPHDIPRGDRAVRTYVAVCQSCHKEVHRNAPPQVQADGKPSTCLDCHMPKRRTEDAVHVVMTDHYIQRQRPPGNLLAPLEEANFEHSDYRGEVVLSYPPELPSTAENDLYLAVAQVQQGSNLTAGIARLEQALHKHKPERPNFYYELARAYSKTSNYEADIRWCQEALRRDANFAPALKELAAAATAIGRLPEAAQALQKAVALRPEDADAFADLGNVFLQQDRVDEAQRALQQALVLDPDMPRANNTMGLTALKRADADAAERFFRAAIRSQPDLAEARNNLGNLLASRKAYAEAGYHFERAVRSDPKHVQALHSYGMVLALTRAYPQAEAQLRAAIRLSPRLAQAHTDLADVLAAMGRADEAAHEYELAIGLNPGDFDAHLALGEILVRQGRRADARLHFEAVARSPVPEMRQAGLEALRALNTP